MVKKTQFSFLVAIAGEIRISDDELPGLVNIQKTDGKITMF